METLTTKPIKSFRDLRVWKEAYKLSIGTYKICESFPKHEQYALASQMCRAAVSVCSNIAEGFGRRTAKEKDQFYGIANGSLTELENQLMIAQGVGYISEVLLTRSMAQCEIVHKMLFGLQKANSKKEYGNR